MKKALYFMPDISGFTKFVNSTEIEHSIHIIAELLETLIDNNIIDLQLVEIEGDALFMFTSKIPDYNDLMKQILQMLEAFHRHTLTYDKMRICNCGSCKTTTHLNLKFLIHYGDLSFIKVKHIKKPYGSDVIKIHRLLKNKIELSEYVLFTAAVFELYKNQINEANWETKSETVDFKNLEYYYKNLDYIKNKLKKEADLVTENEPNKDNPVAEISKIFKANIQTVFTYLSEFKYRHLWDKDIKRVEFEQNKINRMGSEHNCVLNFGNLKFETIGKTTDDDLIYGEKTKSMWFTNEYYYLIKLHKIDEETTKVNLELFLNFGFFGKMMQAQIIQMLTKSWELKLAQLHQLSKQNNNK